LFELVKMLVDLAVILLVERPRFGPLSSSIVKKAASYSSSPATLSQPSLTSVRKGLPTAEEWLAVAKEFQEKYPMSKKHEWF
jgi:hypothetical protein